MGTVMQSVNKALSFTDNNRGGVHLFPLLASAQGCCKIAKSGKVDLFLCGGLKCSVYLSCETPSYVAKLERINEHYYQILTTLFIFTIHSFSYYIACLSG